jgi:hypothetical protein
MNKALPSCWLRFVGYYWSANYATISMVYFAQRLNTVELWEKFAHFFKPM